MMTSTEKFPYNKLAGIGFALILPSLFFVSASVLKYGLGVGFLFNPLEIFYSNPNRLRAFNIVSPAVFLGSLLLALALNAYPILHLNIQKDDDTIVCTLNLKARLWNLMVVAMSFVLLATLLGYAFVENFTHR